MSRGHTLVEVLTALALVAVLAGIAVPGFAALWLDLRRDAALRSLLHAAHAARRLAAVRGEPVLLCGAGATGGCSGLRDWSAGVALATPGGLALRRVQDADAALAIRANRSAFEFHAATRYATTGTITVCDRRGAAAARAVVVSRSGRPRVAERSADGGALQC